MAMKRPLYVIRNHHLLAWIPCKKWMLSSLLVMVFILNQGCSVFKPIHKTLIPIDMVPVPAGTFIMGDLFFEENEDALPLHSLSLPDFWVGQYEITYAQYDAFAKASGLPLPEDNELGRGDRAVVFITWDEAYAFCAAYGLRLPTEQEWEYAARSGGKKELYSGTNDPDQMNQLSRNRDNSAPYVMQPATKEPNGLGIYDMTGNAFEWIGAYYQFYPDSGKTAQWYNLESMDMRVIRGGSFREETRTLHTYWRVAVLRDTRDDDLGFRCAGEPQTNVHPKIRLAGKLSD